MDSSQNLEEIIAKISKWNSKRNYDDDEKYYQQKSSFLSAEARTRGNHLYIQKIHDEKVHLMVLECYSNSIALATENSEEQALAYGNRSALLFHLHKYEECLIDVNRACSITQSGDLKKKLELRKRKCLSFVSNKVSKDLDAPDNFRKSRLNPRDTFFYNFIMKNFLNYSNKTFENELELLKLGKLDKVRESISKLKQPPKIVSPHKTIPNVSDCLSLEYNKKYGRHFVAARDIKPGEILIIEKGLVVPAVEKLHLVCSYCLNFTWNGVPCPHCVFAIYCTEECKTNAWKEYHDIECSILPALLSQDVMSSTISYEMASIRLFIKFFKSEGLERMINEAKSIDSDESDV